MDLSQLEFGALLTYAPRGDSLEIQHSKDVMIVLKRDGFVGKPPILMSEWIAQTIQRKMSELPFASFFQPNTILIPTPKSSLMQPSTLGSRTDCDCSCQNRHRKRCCLVPRQG